MPAPLPATPAFTPADTAATLTTLEVMEHPAGATAVPHVTPPVHDTGVMAMLLVVALLLLTSVGTGYKYLKKLGHHMFSVRRRENLFADHTVNETRIMLALLLCLWLMEGILLFYAVGTLRPRLFFAMQQRVSFFVATLSGCAMAFYLLQLALYRLLGWVFGDKVSTHLWLSGYNATHTLLGLLLIPVAMLVMLKPAHATGLLFLAVFLYFCARIVFISKGFRIFFNNLSSTLYFILYLCAVEIVPPLLTFFGIVYFCQYLQ